MSSVVHTTGQVILHPVVSKSLKIWATTLGREKTYRAIQYFARFYVYILLRNGNKDKAAQWNALKNHLGLGRKLMRLGKPLEHLQSSFKILHTPQAPLLSQKGIERAASLLRQFSYAGYLTFDGVVWANSVKFISLSPEKADRVLKLSLRFWFVGILFGLGNGLVKGRRLGEEVGRLRTGEKSVGEKAESETRIKVLERERASVRYQLLLDVLDMWIPATGLGIVNFNDGVVGMLGLITSLMAFRTQWNSIQMG